MMNASQIDELNKIKNKIYTQTAKLQHALVGIRLPLDAEAAVEELVLAALSMERVVVEETHG